MASTASPTCSATAARALVLVVDVANLAREILGRFAGGVLAALVVPRRGHDAELFLRALQRPGQPLLALFDGLDRAQVQKIADRSAHLYDHRDVAVGHGPVIRCWKRC